MALYLSLDQFQIHQYFLLFLYSEDFQKHAIIPVLNDRMEKEQKSGYFGEEKTFSIIF